MPELPEIHRFTSLLNNYTSILFTHLTSSPRCAIESPNRPFTISSDCQGKELLLRLHYDGAVHSYRVNHGLVGQWEVVEEVSDAYKIVLYGQGVVLGYKDTMNMGRVQVGGFSKGRGPDPVKDFHGFCVNVLRTEFGEKSIAEVMLDQKVFNGIGNYLRAEILYRAGVSPFRKAKELFSGEFNFTTSVEDMVGSGHKGLLVLYLCKAVPEEVLDLGLNKYGNDEEQQRFYDWLRIYGKGEFQKIKGRKIYFGDNENNDPDVPGIHLEPERKQLSKSERNNDPNLIAKMLVLLTVFCRENGISRDKKDFLKYLIINQDPNLFNELTFTDIDIEMKFHSILASEIVFIEEGENAVIATSSAPAYFRSQEWEFYLKEIFNSEEFSNLQNFLKSERSQHAIYPPEQEVYTAFNNCRPSEVKIVIMGQDPYYGQNQAHGLSFSVKKGNKVPASLKRIYRELENSIQGFSSPSHGDLTKWSQNGVLLLNAVLTVRDGKPNSHAHKGWEMLTDKIIEIINTQLTGVVFMLWGKYAQRKSELIDQRNHLVLEAPHPSPLAGTGFNGCGHFATANKYLVSLNKTPVDWNLE